MNPNALTVVQQTLLVLLPELLILLAATAMMTAGAFVRLPDESHRTNGTMTILAGTLMCCSTATKPFATAPSMSCGGRASATWFPDVPTNPRTMASITSGTYGSATRKSIPPRSASPPHLTRISLVDDGSSGQ